MLMRSNIQTHVETVCLLSKQNVEHCIEVGKSRLMECPGKTVDNFPTVLPPLDSDMTRREVEIECKLTEHIQSFLPKLDQGFAFVGR